MLKAGIIGCGWAGKQHAEGYKKNSKVNVVAVTDSNIQNANTLAKKYNIANVYSDYKEMLGNEEVDLVSICTPISTHNKISMDVIASVPNILLEKPMALKRAECEEIISFAKKKNVKVCVCHNRLYFPSIVEMKSKMKQISKNNIIIKINLDLPGAPQDHWKAQKEEGGMLWEEGAHVTYLMQYFLQDILEIQAYGSKSNYAVHDDIRSIIKCKNNNLGIFNITWGKPSDLYMEIFTLDLPPVKLDLDYRSKIVVQSTKSKNFVKQCLKILPKEIISILLTKLKRKDQNMPISYHGDLINDFIDSILADGKPPVSPEEGKYSVQLLEYILESSESGEAIKMDKAEMY